MAETAPPPHLAERHFDRAGARIPLGVDGGDDRPHLRESEVDGRPEVGSRLLAHVLHIDRAEVADRLFAAAVHAVSHKGERENAGRGDQNDTDDQKQNGIVFYDLVFHGLSLFVIFSVFPG